MIRTAAAKTQQEYPFLFYGTDWLAFGHVVIAVAFLGALRDPVRNRWLFDFGLVACAMVIPWAFVFGAVRGIPVWWRLIDCAFGVCGAVPLWWCRRWIKELESGEQQECRSAGFCCSPPAPPTEQLWQNLFWRTPRRFASACARDSCASFWTAPALWRFRLTETALSRTIPGSRQRLMMRPPAKAEV
jgi:hypothetical protein